MWLFESAVQNLKSSPDTRAGIMKVLSSLGSRSLILLLAEQHTAVCFHLWLRQGTLCSLFTLNNIRCSIAVIF